MIYQALPICIGKGYMEGMLSDRESEPIALTFAAMGYHVAVLRYSCGEGACYPTALLQLAKAVTMIRENAEKWGILEDRIIIQGCSAGGHLAAGLGLYRKKKEKLWEICKLF